MPLSMVDHSLKELLNSTAQAIEYYIANPRDSTTIKKTIYFTHRKGLFSKRRVNDYIRNGYSNYVQIMVNLIILNNE
jgi:hypothetical protein